MSRYRVRIALAAGLIALVLARSAAAQIGLACTNPLDPACNHLKCYQIKDKAFTGTTQNLRVDNQFGRELIVRIQPALLCVPSQKACCNAAGCAAANCQPNPANSPALPHLKCYKIKVKSCSDAQCAQLTKFPKTIQVLLHDQFGPEGPLTVGPPRLLCAPTDKLIVGTSSTTTNTTVSTTTSTSTTTTTLGCHDDPLQGCIGPCPPNLPAGTKCERRSDGTCGCVEPPVCCECQGAATMCFNTNDPCPVPGCTTVTNANCNAATGHCDCGFCIDAGTCSNIPCSTSQPCPTGTFCDPVHCPAPCDPCAQGASCNPLPCLRADGTNGQCRQPPGATSCKCCGPTGGFCTSDFDCCSLICNVSAQTCQ